MTRRHATEENVEKVMGLVRGRYGSALNPTAAHKLQPATADEFIALGQSANMAVWQYYRLMHHGYGDSFLAWLKHNHGLEIHELNWVLKELREESPRQLPRLPLDRLPYHFVPSYLDVTEPTIKILYPAGPEWRTVMYDHMSDPREYSDSIGSPSVDTRYRHSKNSSTAHSVKLYAPTIALLHEFEQLLAAPLAFKQAWCRASERDSGGSTVLQFDYEMDPAELADPSLYYDHTEAVVLRSLEQYAAQTPTRTTT